MRLRKIKDAKTKLLDFKNLVIFNPSDYKDKWHEIFKNQNPIYLEIGMGKGKFLSTQAALNPEINFIGLELVDSVVLKAARKINSLNLPNIKLINYDASKLNEIFKEKSISKIFLNFSDPWPKNRHEKRRLTSDSFINLYKTILTDQGMIEFKTDNRKFFEYSLMKFNEHNFKFLEINLNLHEENSDNIITTEYEDKFKLENKTIYYVKVRL